MRALGKLSIGDYKMIVIVNNFNIGYNYFYNKIE